MTKRTFEECVDSFIITGAKEDYEEALAVAIEENGDMQPPDYLIEKIIYNLEVRRGEKRLARIMIAGLFFILALLSLVKCIT